MVFLVVSSIFQPVSARRVTRRSCPAHHPPDDGGHEPGGAAVEGRGGAGEDGKSKAERDSSRPIDLLAACMPTQGAQAMSAEPVAPEAQHSLSFSKMRGIMARLPDAAGRRGAGCCSRAAATGPHGRGSQRRLQGGWRSGPGRQSAFFGFPPWLCVPGKYNPRAARGVGFAGGPRLDLPNALFLRHILLRLKGHIPSPTLPLQRLERGRRGLGTPAMKPCRSRLKSRKAQALVIQSGP